MALVALQCHLLVHMDAGNYLTELKFKFIVQSLCSHGSGHILRFIFSLMFLSINSEVHGDYVLNPSLELVVLLHGGDSFGGPGQDEIPLLQGDEVADVADEKGDGEDHLGGAAALPELVVHLQPQLHVARVRDALPGDELTDGAGGVESFGQGPGQTLGLQLILDVPGCHVQAQSIAGYMLHSGGLGDGRAPLPDHHP